MTTPKDGGHMYPQSVLLSPSGETLTSADWGYGGMTLHQHYAERALQGLATNLPDELPDIRAYADYALAFADAMIEAYAERE